MEKGLLTMRVFDNSGLIALTALEGIFAYIRSYATFSVVSVAIEDDSEV